MSSLVNLKQKIINLFQNIEKKDVVGALGVSAIISSSFLIFRYIYLRRQPITEYLQQISDQIQKKIQTSLASRQPLIIQQQHIIEENNLQVVYTLVSKLKQKQKNKQEQYKNPFLPPFQQGLFIRQLGLHHRLLFNKYNIYNQHLLIVTKQFQPQSNKLNSQDFKQTIYTFKSINGLYFYNSGPKAGASQEHKHIQIFPSNAKDLPIFRQILQFSREIKHKQHQKYNPQDWDIIQYPFFNFKHGMIVIGNTQNGSQSQIDNSKQNSRKKAKLHILKQRTINAYNRLFQKFISNNQSIQYNLFGCEHFIMMVPRRKQKAYNQISINAIGFLGSILFKQAKLLKKYMQANRKGSELLQDITYPKSNK